MKAAGSWLVRKTGDVRRWLAPIAALNLGRTRADDLLSLKIEADCAAVLGML